MFKTSESTIKIYPALIRAQANMPNLYKDSKAHHGNFAGINALLRASYPWLTSYQLAVMAAPTWHEGQMVICCRIIHESSEFIEGMIPVFSIPLEKENSQGLGSRISYVTRYILRSMLGFHNAEFDDDGDYESVPKEVYKPLLITPEQLEQIEYELTDHDDIKDKILKALHITALAQMPRAKFFASLERVREIKKNLHS